VEIVGLERVRNYATAHVMSHPFEMMTAMVTLATAGVFNRYPRLRFGFFEAGCSWAPFWVERIEEHCELMPADFKGGDIHGALRERAYFTFEIEEAGVPATAELGFADRLCFASDYPHFDAVFPGAVDAVRRHGLAPDVERKVLADNALTFYGERLRSLVKA
jgi:predicted TIM-barrel fold metal-dependent hydrolase